MCKYVCDDLGSTNQMFSSRWALDEGVQVRFSVGPLWETNFIVSGLGVPGSASDCITLLGYS